MAKRVNQLHLQFIIDPVAGTNRLRVASYSVDSDAGDGAMYPNTGTPDGAAKHPRDLTAGELSGTVQALLTSILDDAKTTEGIA